MATTKTIWSSYIDTDNYLDTYLLNNDITKEEYEQNPHKYDTSLYEYASEDVSSEFEQIIEEVNHYQEKETKYYVVQAKLGLWNGVHEGGKVVFGMERLISLCMEDYTIISMEGRKMRISATHHDGNNQFYIKELTKEGENYYERHKNELSDREMVEKLFNDRHKSRHVTIWHEIYGL